MNDSQCQALAACIWVMINYLHPEAATGAVTGGLFFWALSPNVPLKTRFILLVGSVMAGYGIGLPAARSETMSTWAWALAWLGASLAHVVIVSLQAMVNSNSNLPPWLSTLLDLLPWRRNRS